ncbi:MAG: HAD hydrolase-like protein, partial [Megasphaera micronuciformis]|nr:HAD hydrolase-like protein [Megasphaera micronuciformis]
IYDIQCGKAIGAKTISVATGHYDKDVLAEQKPWRLFTHLPASAEMTRLIH